jgi:hypothetical protein
MGYNEITEVLDEARRLMEETAGLFALEELAPGKPREVIGCECWVCVTAGRALAPRYKALFKKLKEVREQEFEVVTPIEGERHLIGTALVKSTGECELRLNVLPINGELKIQRKGTLSREENDD